MTTKISFGDKLYRGERSINFVNNRKRWYSLSAVLIVASIFALGAKGLDLGIEFKGGSEFVVNKAGITVPDARAAMDKANVPGDPIVQTVGSSKVRIQTGALTNAQSSKVTDKKMIITNKKTMSAVAALRVISRPQEGPMSRVSISALATAKVVESTSRTSGGKQS